jgi:hypothetical protein
MKDTLRRLKLAKDFTITVPISRDAFVQKLSAITEHGGTGTFSFEALSAGRYEYKGEVNDSGFSIRRKQKFFDTSANMAIAKGAYTEGNEGLIVQGEANAFRGFYIFFMGIAVVFYLSITAVIINKGGETLIALPFLWLHGAFMFCIPFFMMRRSVDRMIYELEREFFYLTK